VSELINAVDVNILNSLLRIPCNRWQLHSHCRHHGESGHPQRTSARRGRAVWPNADKSGHGGYFCGRPLWISFIPKSMLLERHAAERIPPSTLNSPFSAENTACPKSDSLPYNRYYPANCYSDTGYDLSAT